MHKTLPICLAALAVGVLAAVAQAAEPPPGDGPWVVRAHYLNDEMLRSGAPWLGECGVLPARGYAVAILDRAAWATLEQRGFDLELDVEQTAALDRLNQPLPEQTEGIPGFPCYRTVEETFATAQGLVASYPQLASWIDIGDSWEALFAPPAGYDMLVLRLTNALTAGPKPRLLVTGGIHAREYVTPELATRFAERMLERYGEDPDVTWLLDHHEIHLLLQTNPDGRKRAETGLSWRKNANNNYCTNTNDRGADLNRNFDFQWGCCGGSSGSACSITYRGASPGSEPETQAVQAYMQALFPDQRDPGLNAPAPDDATGVYIDLHSFGQVVLSSWGFTGTPPPNGAQILRLGRKWAWFSNYDAQLGSLSTVDGTTKDFAYGQLGVPGYTIELGTTFFESCANFEASILPAGLDMLLYAAKVARTPYMTPAGPDAVDPALPPVPVAVGASVDLTATVDDTRYRGAEPTQNIATAEYTVGVPPWDAGASPLPMSPVDGSFDAKTEAVTASLDTTGMPPGKHLVYLRGQDVTGAWGAVSAVFLYLVNPAVSPVIEGRVVDSESGAPLAATVEIGDFTTSTDPGTGFYSLQVPAGHYRVTAAAAGHAPESNPSVVAGDLQTVTRNFYLAPLVDRFRDDVEAGNAGWSVQGGWSITTEAAFSPTHSWTDSAGTNYPNNANARLTSPPLDFTGLAGVSLSFRHIYDLEQGFDFGYVEASTDGVSWTTVAAFTGEDQTAVWQLEELALPMLDGAAAGQVRFRLDADGFVTADGWHIDDVVVQGAGGAGEEIFTDGFESGDTSAWTAAVP